MSQVSGMNINNMFDNMLNGVSQKGSDLNSKMDNLSKGGSLSNEEMVAIQFQVGQYNVLMESLSTVTKSMTDMCKTLAQRSN